MGVDKGAPKKGLIKAHQKIRDNKMHGEILLVRGYLKSYVFNLRSISKPKRRSERLNKEPLTVQNCVQPS